MTNAEREEHERLFARMSEADQSAWTMDRLMFGCAVMRRDADGVVRYVPRSEWATTECERCGRVHELRCGGRS